MQTSPSQNPATCTFVASPLPPNSHQNSYGRIVVASARPRSRSMHTYVSRRLRWTRSARLEAADEKSLGKKKSSLCPSLQCNFRASVDSKLCFIATMSNSGLNSSFSVQSPFRVPWYKDKSYLALSFLSVVTVGFLSYLTIKRDLEGKGS